MNQITDKIYGQDIKLNYDSTRLEYVDAVSTDNGISLLSKQDQAGTLRLILASQGADHAVTGTKEFIEITFKAKTVQQASNGVLSVAVATLGDGDGKEIEVAGSSLGITINPEVIKISSDINNDGKVSIGDLAIVAAFYGATSSSPNWTQAKKADVNGDNVVDIKDLSSIANEII